MRYLSLLVIPLVLALVGAARRPGRHVRRAAPSPAPIRSSRVRPYAQPIPVTEPPPAYEVPPRALLVRPYVLDAGHCARRRAAQREPDQTRTDARRLGRLVLKDLSHPAVRVPAPTPAPDSTPPARRALVGVH
ncbi:hypothetical protein F4561_005789 [Lipingzhangella halophila]|uniref:Uncharacterized protein n=1 Tax=Lipingzhangella halophila TaxID=1783352 RepID=A0A7W7RMT2_9ACTN|nr:hypothetical protein [Lipingzhangella halophila]MBB4934895.1 hypothetical protein [Lipingzhangella halophila]